MMGSFLTRGLIMIFGYSYPAYECYKTVEKKKLDIEQLRFWCQYWILVALLTVFEKIGDTLISWVPMYVEAKLAFFVYLWFPKTKGARYVYDAFLRPYLVKHEKEIDRNLLELKTRAADIAFIYSQKAATYVQTRVFEILQYFTPQPTPKPRPNQQKQEVTKASQAPPTIQQKQPQETPHTSSSGTTPQLQSEASQEAVPSTASDSITPLVDDKPSKEVNKEIEADKTKPQPALSSSKSDVCPTPEPEETLMEETIRVTRGRLRKTRSTETR